MDNHLPSEIFQEVLLYSHFITQIRLRQLNKFVNRLEIHDFYNIDIKFFPNNDGYIEAINDFISRICFN